MKFSIVTPSFNQVDFIGETIESVLTQRGDFEIEYFIFDGGSSDGTLGILKKYDKKIKAGEFKKYKRQYLQLSDASPY